MFVQSLVPSSRTVFLGVLFLASFLGATETPFTPYKDGNATPSTYNGNSRTLQVSDPDSKAWVSHPVGDGAERGVTKARLQVYVKDVVREGKLRVFRKTALDRLENQTRYGDITAADSLGDSVVITMKDVQRVVNIPLGSAFLKGLANYDGIVLEGDEGLEAELGALEGGHGAMLYLTYAQAVDSIPVKSVAQVLVQSHLSEIKGRDGTNGLNGRNGVDGKDGATGKDGKPGDSTLVFRLLQDRSSRAYYPFDRFGTSNANRTAPDSSDNGNDLTLSANGTNLRSNAPGDSVVEFLGNGYAVASNSLSLNPYKEIMISARVKLSSDAPPDTQVILSKGDQYELAVIGNRLVCRFKTVSGDWAWLGGGSVPNGVWVTVGAGYDGKDVRTFVNGLQKSYVHFPNGPLVMESTSLYLGASNASGDHGLKGILDQVRITSYVVNLQDSLAVIPGRATMAQVVADSVAGLKGLLDARALVSHSHSIAQVTALQTALDGKANTSHGHSVADVTGLQTALQGKSDVSHGHTIASVDGLGDILNAKANYSNPFFSGPIEIANNDNSGGATDRAGIKTWNSLAFYSTCCDLTTAASPGILFEPRIGRTWNRTGAWANLSDRRLKRDIQPLHGSLERVLALQGVSFHWTDLSIDSAYGLQRGFIAQDVEKVFPEWVKINSDGYKSIEKIGVEAVLVEAIKEQQKQIEGLKTIICADHPNVEICGN